jgi:hypothetical protein
MRDCQVEGHTRPAHQVAGVTVAPAPWPGLWLVTWTQPDTDPGGWCTCPWEIWRLGAHACSASRRLLDGWQVRQLPDHHRRYWRVRGRPPRERR